MLSSTVDRIKTLVAGLSVGVVSTGIAAGVLWFALGLSDIKQQATEVSVPAKEAPAVKRVPSTTVAVKRPVKVYGPSAAAKLKLPADVGPNEPVIAATQVRGSDRPQTVTTVINTETGESRSFVKQDPLPWFALETRGEVRLAYGYKADYWGVRPVARLSAGYDVVRIKALTAGVSGSIDSDGDAFVGIGVTYRW